MYTQIITAASDSVVVPIPEELRGKTIEIIMNDLGENGKKQFSSGEEFHAQFRALQLDLRGFKFNRDEANER